LETVEPATLLRVSWAVTVPGAEDGAGSTWQWTTKIGWALGAADRRQQGRS
jgi:hypothetical protein